MPVLLLQWYVLITNCILLSIRSWFLTPLTATTRWICDICVARPHGLCPRVNVKNTDHISTARVAICRSLEEPARACAAAAVVHPRRKLLSTLDPILVPNAPNGYQALDL